MPVRLPFGKRVQFCAYLHFVGAPAACLSDSEAASPMGDRASTSPPSRVRALDSTPTTKANTTGVAHT